MKCSGNHPKKNECVFCFAEKNEDKEICIDMTEDYFVCKKHEKMLKEKKDLRDIYDFH